MIMSIKTKIKNAWNAWKSTNVDLNDEELLEWLGISGTPKKLLSEVTYYTCIKMLSETMGKLPLKYYQETDRGKIRAEPTENSKILTMRPNQIMTPSTLWSTTEQNCQHYGNGYVWIRRMFVRKKYGGEYKTLDVWPMQSNYVTVLLDDAGVFGGKGKIYYQYSDPKTGELYVFPNQDVMHFKTWHSLDGIISRPVKDVLGDTIGGALESQNFLNTLYKNGLTASMVMQYTGDFAKAKRKELEKRYASPLTGPKNAGRVVPVPIGLTLTPLKMNLTDAQFLELKKHSALQIAGAFGIKPNQINNYEKSSYANSETQQLAFLIDTMSFRLRIYEEEINKKYLLPDEEKNGNFYKFNEKAILRTDSKTQMDNIVKAVQNGLYTQNEGREYLDKPAKEGGDILVMNGNYIPSTMVGTQYAKGGEQNANLTTEESE